MDDAECDRARCQRHMRAGDDHRALASAKAITRAKKWGRDRDAAWFVQGVIYRDQERHNLASEAFTKVRAAKGPLAPWGAYYEAEQDLNRGKPAVAVRECETYLKTWPDGVHADACHRLIARGLAETDGIPRLEAAEMIPAPSRTHL